MIRINKNSNNNIVVTVTELSTLDTSNYLIEFINKQTKASSFCLLGNNLSNFKERFDEFVITEQTNPDPLLSQIELSSGQYIYNIFELSNEQVNALDFDNIDTSLYLIVEYNCQAMVSISESNNTFYSGSSITNTVYE